MIRTKKSLIENSLSNSVAVTVLQLLRKMQLRPPLLRIIKSTWYHQFKKFWEEKRLI